MIKFKVSKAFFPYFRMGEDAPLFFDPSNPNRTTEQCQETFNTRFFNTKEYEGSIYGYINNNRLLLNVKNDISIDTKMVMMQFSNETFWRYYWVENLRYLTNSTIQFELLLDSWMTFHPQMKIDSDVEVEVERSMSFRFKDSPNNADVLCIDFSTLDNTSLDEYPDTIETIRERIVPNEPDNDIKNLFSYGNNLYVYALLTPSFDDNKGLTLFSSIGKKLSAGVWIAPLMNTTNPTPVIDTKWFNNNYTYAGIIPEGLIMDIIALPLAPCNSLNDMNLDVNVDDLNWGTTLITQTDPVKGTDNEKINYLVAASGWGGDENTPNANWDIPPFWKDVKYDLPKTLDVLINGIARNVINLDGEFNEEYEPVFYSSILKIRFVNYEKTGPEIPLSLFLKNNETDPFNIQTMFHIFGQEVVYSMVFNALKDYPEYIFSGSWNITLPSISTPWENYIQQNKSARITGMIGDFAGVNLAAGKMGLDYASFNMKRRGASLSNTLSLTDWEKSGTSIINTSKVARVGEAAEIMEMGLPELIVADFALKSLSKLSSYFTQEADLKRQGEIFRGQTPYTGAMLINQQKLTGNDWMSLGELRIMEPLENSRQKILLHLRKYGQPINRFLKFNELEDFAIRSLWNYWQINEFSQIIGDDSDIPAASRLEINQRFENGIRLWSQIESKAYEGEYNKQNWESDII